MELNENFLKNQSEDVRNSANDVSADNDSIGENSEQTPVAQALQKDREREAESKGWENNRPGATTSDEDDQRIYSVTPVNDNGMPGPEDDDFGDQDDDDDELIPIETDDDDDFLAEDDDNDDIDDVMEEKKEIPHKEHGHHHHIDISHVVPSEERPFGRTSGRMIDHEPGTSPG